MVVRTQPASAEMGSLLQRIKIVKQSAVYLAAQGRHGGKAGRFLLQFAACDSLAPCNIGIYIHAARRRSCCPRACGPASSGEVPISARHSLAAHQPYLTRSAADNPSLPCRFLADLAASVREVKQSPD